MLDSCDTVLSCEGTWAELAHEQPREQETKEDAREDVASDTERRGPERVKVIRIHDALPTAKGSRDESKGQTEEKEPERHPAR
jgi:hypothetical protein